MVTAGLLLLALGSTTSAACPADSHFNKNFGKCYKLVSTPSDFMSAEISCRSIGGNLVVIRNVFENNFVAGMGSQFPSFWIGSNLLKTSNWTWTSSSNGTYTNFAPGQPSDPNIYQCAAVRDEGYLWTSCSTQKPYMCQIDPNASPVGNGCSTSSYPTTTSSPRTAPPTTTAPSNYSSEKRNKTNHRYKLDVRAIFHTSSTRQLANVTGMEQKQHENEEYIARNNAEIAELENEEVEARLQKLQLKTEQIADMKKMITSNQKSAEERIAALEEQMQTVAVQYVDIGESLNERIDSLQTSIEGILQIQTALEQTVETLERSLKNKLEWKEYGTILVLGGHNSNKMHLLNRDRKRWSTLSLKLPLFLTRGGAVYLDGEIYIFGGWNSDKKTYKLNREMKWIQLTDMNEERRNITNSAVVFDGCIWVFGGWNDSEKHLNSVEKYIPEENEWIQMPSMKEKCEYAAAAACKGKLFVSGGMNGDRTLRSMECFDPASQKWTMFLDLPSPTFGHAMISDGISLTVLGGAGEENSVWKINPNEEKATWKKLLQIRESRCFFTANLLGNDIFAIGGEKGKKVEFFNGETWEDGPEHPEEISFMCSIVVSAHLAAALSSRQ